MNNTYSVDSGQGFDIAVLGATGVVGEMMLTVLAERQFPVRCLYPLASSRSAGSTVQFGERTLTVLDVASFDFSQVQIALFSAGKAVSERYAPQAVEAGCVVIDNTSAFRYDPDVPLVVPEVNGHDIALFRSRLIIANPNCATIQMVVALKPIHNLSQIVRINVATYQAVSGSGQQGIHALANQSAKLLNGQSLEETTPYDRRIAFNVIPLIDQPQENGYTREEMKMVWETVKLLGDTGIGINPTAVRVPVFFGHAMALHIETTHKLELAQVAAALEQAPGIVLKQDTPASAPTPAIDAVNQDSVYVGRLREDISHARGLNLWVVSDNLRKGAALNAVQIAESLIKDFY